MGGAGHELVSARLALPCDARHGVGQRYEEIVGCLVSHLRLHSPPLAAFQESECDDQWSPFSLAVAV